MHNTESYKDFIKRKTQQFTRGALIPMKDIGRSGKHFFKREAWTFMPQSNLKQKVFLVERLRKVKTSGRLVHRQATKIGAVEYRIGYFMVGKNGNRRGKWVWGQFCPLIPSRDLKRLLDKARKDGTIRN